MSTVVTSNPDPVKALFKKVFGPMQPPKKPETVTDKVRKLRRYLNAEVRRGLTLQQLCEGLATPDFNIRIKPGRLGRILHERRKPNGALAAQARVDAAQAAGPARGAAGA